MTLGLLLTTAAGFVDAVGFIELGGYYISFMSGNTTQLGTAIATDPAWLLMPASLVFQFFIGGFLGALLVSVPRRGQLLAMGLVLFSVVLVLLLTLAGFPPAQTMLILALGAGAQNAVLPTKGAARLGATFVTGTLFAAAQDLAGALRHKVPPWRWLQHLMVWAALLIGALLGAAVHSIAGTFALFVPALLYLGFFIAFAAQPAVPSK